MKNSTLLFRSLVIILFITGGAHLISYASGHLNPTNNDISKEEYLENPSNKDKTASSLETDYIIGKWKVNYNTKDYSGAIIYDLKKEEGIYNAYTYEYQDAKSYREKAEGTKVLAIKNFDGYKGKGIYTIDYEGQQYQVDCAIDMMDENTFKLSYDYYGYSAIETWKKQN